MRYYNVLDLLCYFRWELLLFYSMIHIQDIIITPELATETCNWNATFFDVTEFPKVSFIVLLGHSFNIKYDLHSSSSS